MVVNQHGASMFANDRGSETLGIELLESGEGRATTRLGITAAMLNGLDLCHGGFVFALADTALAFAANSDGDERPTTTATIRYRRPARAGDVLTARARVVGREDRDLLVDVEVTNDRKETVATLQGRSRQPG